MGIALCYLIVIVLTAPAIQAVLHCHNGDEDGNHVTYEGADEGV
jgi:hypothetical protein